MAAGGANNCRDWTIGLYGGLLGALYRPSNGNCTAVLQSSVDVEVGTWYHVALTLDGSTARFYVNGVLEASGETDPNYALEESFLIGHASCPQCV